MTATETSAHVAHEPEHSDIIPVPSGRYAKAYRITALRPSSQPYIRRWSFGFDLRIVWSTVFGRGAHQNAY